MLDIKEQYIIDTAGERVGVILDLETYQKQLEALVAHSAITARN